MPSTVEPLFIFAEVAIALAGFASLVTVIDRGGGDPMALDANRLRNLIDVSLLVVVFSLFPMVPFEFGVAEESAWRVSSAAFLAVTSVYLVVAGRRQRFMRQRNIAIRRPWARALWTLAGGMVATLVLGMAGVGGDIGAAWYVTALFLTLVSAALIFILVIASTLQPYRDAPGPASGLGGDAVS
ncbi:MAG TPA: hypothetical protein VK837_14255 [Longimicrobiales bacterium]|nr:hypothetical protein [Longimicrobiales bacterium]